MGTLVTLDLTKKIDRKKYPRTWATTLMNYMNLCAASGREARAKNVQGAKYLGKQAAALHALLW